MICGKPPASEGQQGRGGGGTGGGDGSVPVCAAMDPLHQQPGLPTGTQERHRDAAGAGIGERASSRGP